MSEFYEFQGYRIPVDLLNMTGGGPDTFDAISAAHIDYLQQKVGLTPHQSVLEIGCGIGRDAIPLSSIIQPPGRYLGVDIIGRSIEWCRANIAARNPHFEFAHFDVRDALHNPGGIASTRDFSFPVADQSVDRVIMWSVLTHMFEPDIVHYFREFQRALKSDGLVMATCFCVDDETLASARTVDLTPWSLRFEHAIGNGCFINDLKSPAGAVAFTPEALDRMVAAGGLEMVRPVLRGQWSGRPGGEGAGQDVLILRRKAPH